MRYKKNVKDYFFIGIISFYLFIENVFIKIKNSIFPPKYTRYGKNVRDKFNKLYVKHIEHTMVFLKHIQLFILELLLLLWNDYIFYQLLKAHKFSSFPLSLRFKIFFSEWIER